MPAMVGKWTTRAAVRNLVDEWRIADAAAAASAAQGAFAPETVKQLGDARLLLGRQFEADSDPLTQVSHLLDRLEVGWVTGAPPWQILFEVLVLLIDLFPRAWLQAYTKREFQGEMDSDGFIDLHHDWLQANWKRVALCSAVGVPAEIDGIYRERGLIIAAGPRWSRETSEEGADNASRLLTFQDARPFPEDETASMAWRVIHRATRKIRNDLAHGLSPVNKDDFDLTLANASRTARLLLPKMFTRPDSTLRNLAQERLAEASAFTEVSGEEIEAWAANRAECGGRGVFVKALRRLLKGSDQPSFPCWAGVVDEIEAGKRDPSDIWLARLAYLRGAVTADDLETVQVEIQRRLGWYEFLETWETPTSMEIVDKQLEGGISLGEPGESRLREFIVTILRTDLTSLIVDERRLLREQMDC
jgi:hypothetical protein